MDLETDYDGIKKINVIEWLLGNKDWYSVLLMKKSLQKINFFFINSWFLHIIIVKWDYH